MCGSSQMERRMTTFGVSFDDHIQSMNVDVPIIVSKCIEEIDKRGLDIKVCLQRHLGTLAIHYIDTRCS